MEESKVAKYGFYISILGLIVALLALIRDYFDFKESPEDLGKFFDKGSTSMYITVGLFTFIIGYLFHKFGVFRARRNEVRIIRSPKILVAYTDENIFGNDKTIISNSKLSRSVTYIKNVTVDELRTHLSNNEYDIVHLGIPIEKNGEIKIEQEVITSKALMNLLELSKTQLLILGSCSSVNLAADTVNLVNMVAATGNLNSEEFEKWEGMFYSLLAEEYELTRAFNISKSTFANLLITMILKEDIQFKKR